MPMGLFRTLSDPARTWAYALEPDPVTGSVLHWMRGRMVGGSSSINGMLYFRGQPEDYDGWEAMGCTGWGWGEMFRVFREMEDHELGDDGVRGVGGPLHVSVQKERSPLTDALLMAGQGLGLPVKEDLNRPDQEGIGYSPRTIRNGRRVSAADAFLRPALRRGNVTLRTGTMATQLLAEDGRVTGVRCRDRHGAFTIHATREIILAAGALQSPLLLQLSGIGDPAYLSGLGIPVLASNSDVGRNAREHKMITMNLRVRGHSLNHSLRGWRKYLNGARYFATHSGPLSRTYDVNAFVRTRPGLTRPDAQLTFWALSPERDAYPMAVERHPGLMMMGYPLRTESQGEIKIRSSDPAVPPVAQANFLASDYDRTAIVNLFRYARRLLAQPAVAPFIVEESSPGSAVESDEDIITSSRADGSCAHTVGTCRMGADGGSVVDPRVRVRGVTGLRVVDCSVMPTQVSSNPNGPVMAMAWRASELILADNRRL